MLSDVLPVCTWSPICSSDIITDFPFSSLTLEADGKQPPPDGAAVVVVVVSGSRSKSTLQKL